MNWEVVAWGTAGFVAAALWAEFREVAPWLAKRLVNFALTFVPGHRRERDAEEWASILAETPGKLSPLFVALGFCWGATKESIRLKFGIATLNGMQRAMDIVGALIFFALLGGVYVVVYWMLRISQGGPVHYYQVRIGKDGKPFKFYKFRTMVLNSDAVLDEFLTKNDAARAEWGTYQKLERDPRFTPVGYLIRRASLDELPQFWNVLKGDMSLVGPRPCMARQTTLYGEHFKDYCAVRPGITGLWQLGGRNSIPYHKRVQLDVYYAKNRSMWLNLKILWETVRAVFTGDGSR